MTNISNNSLMNVSLDDFINALNGAYTKSRKDSERKDKDFSFKADELEKEYKERAELEERYEKAGYLRKLALDKEYAEEMRSRKEESLKKLKELEEQIANETDEERKERLEKLYEKAFEKHKEHLSKLESAEKKLKGRNWLSEAGKGAQNFMDKLNGIKRGFDNIMEPWKKVDAAASKFTKTIGGTKAAMDKLRKDSINAITGGIGVKFNISMEELIQAQSKYVDGIGRNLSIGASGKESLAAIASFSESTGINGLDLAAQFENFGVGIEETGDHLGKMFSEASKNGINLNKYADNVHKNIKLAQNYTFKNGIKGLESMAKRATALKMDIQQAVNFADKVRTVEGALETSAKLQVLGGPFAATSNPLEMLYESLYDMEGFGKRIERTLGNLGDFNKKTGEVSVSVYNKERIRAYAEATGQDYSAVMDMVHNMAKRGEIDKQINSSTAARGFDEDLKELIRNTGTFKNGKVGINTAEGYKTLDEIKDPESVKNFLKQQTQTQSEDIKEIVTILRSLSDIDSGLKKQKEAVQAKVTGPLGQVTKFLSQIFNSSIFTNSLLGTLVAIQGVATVGQMFGGMGRGGLGRGGMLGRGGIFRRGASRAGNRALIKMFGKKGATRILGGAASKAAAQTATKSVATTAVKSVATKAAAKGLGRSILGSVAKGGGIGAVLGIGGAIGNHFTDKAVAEGKMEKGGTAHHLAKMGSQALQWGGTGMAIGSIFGPVGTAIGGAIGAAGGAIVGLVQAAKAKNEVIVDNQLKDMGLQRKGDYRRGQLKKLDKALRTGEMSDRLRRKLIQKGDIELVKAIDKKKEELEAKNAEKEEKAATKNRMKINKANIVIKSANITGIGNSFGAGIIKGVKEVGVSNIIKKDSINSENVTNKQTENKPKTFDININGTLKLTGDNGQSIDIIKILKKDDQMLRNLVSMISVELGKFERGNDYRSNYKIMNP